MLVVNMTKYELKVDGKVVDTPPKELELPLPPGQQSQPGFTPGISCWTRSGAFEYYGDSRTVDVHVKRLRESWRASPTNGA